YTWSLSKTGPASSNPGGSDTNNANDQSRLVVNGDLTMTPAAVNVVGLSGLTFDNTQSYSWRVATATGTITLGSSQPTFNTTGLNAGGGSFQLSSGGGSGFLTFSPIPEP